MGGIAGGEDVVVVVSRQEIMGWLPNIAIINNQHLIYQLTC